MFSRATNKQNFKYVFDEAPYAYINIDDEFKVQFGYDGDGSFGILYDGFSEASLIYRMHILNHISVSSPFTLSIPDFSSVIDGINLEDFGEPGDHKFISFMQSEQGWEVATQLNEEEYKNNFLVGFSFQAIPSTENLDTIKADLKKYVGKTYTATLTSNNAGVLNITGEQPITFKKMVDPSFFQLG